MFLQQQYFHSSDKVWLYSPLLLSWTFSIIYHMSMSLTYGNFILPVFSYKSKVNISFWISPLILLMMLNLKTIFIAICSKFYNLFDGGKIICFLIVKSVEMTVFSFFTTKVLVTLNLFMKDRCGMRVILSWFLLLTWTSASILVIDEKFVKLFLEICRDVTLFLLRQRQGQ